MLFNFWWICGYSQENKRIIEICDSLLGKKVGGGNCGEFVLYVLNEVYGKNKYPHWGVLYRNKPFIPYLQAGDNIIIKKAFVAKEGNIMMVFKKHSAIVYHVIDDCRIALIHQSKGMNVCIEKFNFCGGRGKIKVIISDQN